MEDLKDGSPRDTPPPPVDSTTNLHAPHNERGSCESQTPPLNTTASDADRLRMLGYDAVLGRPFGFWGSAAMNICQLNFVNEFYLSSQNWGYRGPLLWIIGYPVAFVFHLLLVGVMSQFASAYPVAGAMATWSWKSARHGVRREREWGWLASGLVLAMHVGRVLALLYELSTGTAQVYVMISDIPVNPLTGYALVEEKWWNPTFHMAIVTVIAFFTLTRLTRTNLFWILTFVFNVGFGILAFVVIVLCGTKTWGMPKNLGYPEKGTETFPRNLAWMIFVGLPWKLIPFDSSAHMSEETRNPSKTVPRSMIAAVVFHFLVTYTLVTLYIFLGVPGLGALSNASVVMMLIFVYPVANGVVYFVLIYGNLCIASGLLSSVVLTSRYLFALGRDYCIPYIFSKTSKDREPWVADIAVVASMYISVFAYFVSQSNIGNICVCFSWWFTSVAYIVPLGLYLFSDIDFRDEKTEFTLHKWGKPAAAVCIGWLLVTIIIGAMPISIWVLPGFRYLKVDTFSSFVIVTAAIIVALTIAWFVYGRSQYIGPIRAITGDAADYSTSDRRAGAVRQYLKLDEKVATPAVEYTYVSAAGSVTSRLARLKSKFKLSRSSESKSQSFELSENRKGTGVPTAATEAALPESAIEPSRVSRSRFPSQNFASVLPDSELEPRSVMSGVDDSVVAEPSLDLTPTIDPAHFERAEQQKRARKITFATFGQIESGSKHPWLHDRA